MPLVEDQVFVKKGRSSPPMADDENRIFFDRRAFDLSAVPTLLQDAQHRMTEADNGDNGRDPPISEADLKPVVHHQPNPRQKMTPLPHVGRPFLLPRRRLPVVGVAHGGISVNSLFFQSPWIVQAPVGATSPRIFTGGRSNRYKLGIRSPRSVFGRPRPATLCRQKKAELSLVSGYDKNVESSSPSARWRRLVSGRGVEQWQLARFIPWRSQVQILPPQFRHGSNTDSTRK